jgi:hypothetical protein
MLRLFVHLQTSLLRLAAAPEAAVTAERRGRRDAGQSTVEYALVLLGVAALALLVVQWASKSDAISKLFDFVIGHVIGAVS